MERSDKSLRELMQDLMEQISRMFRHEVALARAEMGEKANQASSGIAMLAIALLLGMGAVVILLLSAVTALNAVLDPWLSALIVGVIAVLVAAALAAKGRANLKARNLVPSRTIDSVRGDTELAKEKLR